MPAPGGPLNQKVMTPGRCDLERAARLFLPVHLVEVVLGGLDFQRDHGVRWRLGLDWLLACDVCDHACEVVAWNDLESIDQGGLDRVGCGDEDSLKPMPVEPTRGNDDSIHVAHRAIKGQLANKCRARRCDLAHHRQGDRDRHRQVQATAFLTQFCRGPS